MFAAAESMSVPSTLATSSRYLVLPPSSQATAGSAMFSIEPAGRLLSFSQVTWGTLNCICTGSAATSAGVSVAERLEQLRAWPCRRSASAGPGSGCAITGRVAELGQRRPRSRAAACRSGRGGRGGRASRPAWSRPASAGGVGRGVAARRGARVRRGAGAGRRRWASRRPATGRSLVILSTLRKRSCAGTPTWRMVSLFSPGTEITMWLSPSVTTSASATPNALTRFSMISRAGLQVLGARRVPVRVVATSVSVVPPTRSRPSFGSRRSLNEPLPKPSTMPNRTTKIAPSAKRYRDGRIWP